MLRRMRTALLLATVLLSATPALAQLPPPPAQWADWDTSWHADDPGELSADALLDKPAGRRGGIVVKGGHFYSGDARVRFWGVNLAFAASFPPHEMADQLARRFARYGINAVRFHHMDNQPFPNGIFADTGLEKLSPEALDRLDYFVAALKAQGIYADLNLHVSRNYSHYHASDGHDGPRIDKIVDLFDPELIAAQRRYAADLLTHINAYTHARYADEPAVGLVEINNENSLFMWGAEQTLADLPEPYAAELRQQWNDWLTKRYDTRAKLAAAWATPVEPAGPNLLRDAGHAAAWHLEQHAAARATLADADGGVRVVVTKPDELSWHVQVNQTGLTLTKGRAYHLTFRARADRPVAVGVSVGQAHDPWQSLGLYKSIRVDPQGKTVTLGFTATADDTNGRLSFAVGSTAATINLAGVDLHAGGGSPGLLADEDLGTVRFHADDDPAARRDDRYRFLTDAESAYYDGMRTYLHTTLGVKCPITGTIGFGPLGTSVQSHQDFVDAHAYWQHPTFPHKPWDPADWTIPNTPMVDSPNQATLWQLAATRVTGLPFTVTEYQHPAPNDWAAECIPEIASFAAMQDWDGVFLFAYSHDGHYDKGRIASFFDIEGNPTKMPLMPIGARLFLGSAVPPVPLKLTAVVSPGRALAGANQTDMATFLRSTVLDGKPLGLNRRVAVQFSATATTSAGPDVDIGTCSWAAAGGPGSGLLSIGGGAGGVQVGFTPVGAETPYFSLCSVPADPSRTLDRADRLLVTAVARAQNTGMVWNAARTSVGNHWGHAPVQIEVVHADVTVPGRWSHAWALDPAGRRTAVDVAEPHGGDTVLHLGRSAALAYVVVR